MSYETTMFVNPSKGPPYLVQIIHSIDLHWETHLWSSVEIRDYLREHPDVIYLGPPEIKQ